MKTVDRLRSIKVVNTHELLLRFGVKGRTDVAVYFCPAQPHLVRPALTCIYSPSHKTNPGGAWYDYGRKSFVGGRVKSLTEALAWASDRYGIPLDDWVPDPTQRGSYVPRDVREKAFAALKKEQKK